MSSIRSSSRFGDCEGLTDLDRNAEPTWKEQDIVNACAAGDVNKVRQYFEHTNTRELGHNYNDSYHTSAYDFLKAAILNKRASLLKYLLSISSCVEFYGDTLLDTALQNPDPDTFRTIYEHVPSIVNYHYKHIMTPLMESCRGGNPLIPKFLLDHGADPNWGGWVWRGGPLVYAVIEGQPLWLIKKMVKLGADISVGHMYRAIHVQRLDALEFLLRKGSCDTTGKIVELAHEYGNKDIIALVEKRARNLTRRDKKLVSEIQMKTSTEKSSGSHRTPDAPRSRFSRLRGCLSRAAERS
ncbi:MAG: hypothetical protein LQ338_002953 [Usnochroma carphineum]|nr:MAG: hypothetical protein LQ338_002953 [Usnochroma carphineum]